MLITYFVAIALPIIVLLLIAATNTLGKMTKALEKLADRPVAPPPTALPAPVNDAEQRDNLNALRLQACERLTLMLERISVPNLLLRLPTGPATSAKKYTATLLLAIREEFEYNVTQQIYVSDALWSVISQARDNVSQLIVRAADGADDGPQVASRLRLMSSRQPDNAIGLGQEAIRREASLVLG